MMFAFRKWLCVCCLLPCLLGPLSGSGYEKHEKNEKPADSVNVYTWSDVIPVEIIRQFEAETGIRVNFSTYDSNEILYARLKVNSVPLWDVIEPSSYFLDRMRRENMLESLDHQALHGFRHLDPLFLNREYDPGNRFSVPYIWGITGLFFDPETTGPVPTAWADLWHSRWKNQILLLDDMRDVFSMALLSLGYSINDKQPAHLQKAYEKLRALLPNIHLFKSDGITSLLSDGEAPLGMAWNGDVYRARQVNPSLAFVYPKEGFAIWVDNFAIPRNAPHRQNALRFIDFMLRPDVAKQAALFHGYATANLAARKKLPRALQRDPVQYPPKSVLKRGQFQQDLDDRLLDLYEKYWQKLKMGE